MTDTARRTLRTAGPAAAVVGVAACALAWLLQHEPGLVGAALGSAVSWLFFAVGVLVMEATRRIDPQLVMGVAVLTYGTKVGLLMVLLVALRDALWLSGTAFAASVIATSLTWLAAQVHALRRSRLPVYDL